MTGIEQAVQKAGGQADLAAVLRPAVTQQAVSKWVARGWLPADRAVEVEKLYGIALRDLVSPTLAKVLS